MSITSVARLQPPIIHRRDAVAAGAQSLRLVCGALLSEVARRSGRTPSAGGVRQLPRVPLTWQSASPRDRERGGVHSCRFRAGIVSRPQGGCRSIRVLGAR